MLGSINGKDDDRPMQSQTMDRATPAAPAAAQPSHIRIRGLSKTYPNGTRALQGVDLDIPLGMFGLLGPNGASKSSLMRTLATLQEADAGSIQFGDIDVLRDKGAMRQQLGYLPQSFGVYPGVSAVQLLDHLAILKGLTNAKERRQVVEELLRQVDLYDHRHKAVSGFSGGMRQRFGIAQTLLGHPRVIIVDEPTAGLDPAQRTRFLNLLSQVSEQAAIILSTHIVEDVSELCPQMAIIADGRVVLHGEPQALMDQLDGRVWQATIERDQLADYARQQRVISSRFYLGRIVVNVFAEAQPGPTFEPVPPDLKDVYFSALAGWLKPAPEFAEAA
jgi:ABC-2 type transport system ATP-binding protein